MTPRPTPTMTCAFLPFLSLVARIVRTSDRTTGGVMGELASALDALVVDDLHVMGSAALLDRTAELVRARNRIDAELARTIRVGDLRQAPEHDGQKTMRSWP